MRIHTEIYGGDEHRFISGEFRPLREMENGGQLGYFESSDCANILVVMLLYPDGTYAIAERLKDMLTQDTH